MKSVTVKIIAKSYRNRVPPYNLGIAGRFATPQTTTACYVMSVRSSRESYFVELWKRPKDPGYPTKIWAIVLTGNFCDSHVKETKAL